MRHNRVMFKMLFRSKLYTLEQVEQMVKINPDILWVVYQVQVFGGREEYRPGEIRKGIDGETLLSKYG